MTPGEYKAKLMVLLRAVTRIVQEPGMGQHWPPKVQPFFDNFWRHRDALATEIPSIASDLPPKRSVSAWSQGQREYIVDADLITLANDIAHTIDLLDAEVTGSVVPTVNREGLFLPGQEFDAFRQIGKILSPATRSINIVDGYVDETVLDLLSAKKPGVEARILTRQVGAALKMAAEKFNKQHGGLAIRTSKAIHDRFLVLDDAEVFHFGGSIKDAGKRGTMFSRVEEPAVVRAFHDLWRGKWASGTPVVG